MVIQTRFSDRDYAFAAGQLAQRSDDILFHLLDVTRMNTNDRKDIRMLFRQLHRAPATFHGRPERDDSRYASLSCTPQDIVKIGREIRIIEVRMSLNQHRSIVGRFPKTPT